MLTCRLARARHVPPARLIAISSYAFTFDFITEVNRVIKLDCKEGTDSHRGRKKRGSSKTIARHKVRGNFGVCLQRLSARLRLQVVFRPQDLLGPSLPWS